MQTFRIEANDDNVTQIGLFLKEKKIKFHFYNYNGAWFFIVSVPDEKDLYPIIHHQKMIVL